ncbi:MAG: DUF5615 family PIN-like protein [Calditrichaceae bacterium]|nr:DUF5615 family PIN-like protein [Calditrichaceae bacterium]
MKFKLDENFGSRTQKFFIHAGHDVETVREEGLSGIADKKLYRFCIKEQRCLVTLDLDFSDTLRFPPEKTAGIVVIRVPQNPSIKLLERMVSQFLENLKNMPVEKQLWIMEVGRIRIHQKSVD